MYHNIKERRFKPDESATGCRLYARGGRFMSIVYVCDDDKLVLMMVRRILENCHSVKTCERIDALIDMVVEEKPDLILLDFKMPGATGLDGIRKLKEMNCFDDIPVIMITGERDAELEIKCMNEGVEDFLRKPFVPDVLVSHVQRVLERKASRNDMEQKMEEAIKRSRHDSMTGLYNRDYAIETIDMELLKNKPGAFIMVDLDNFKYLNDTYGHITGDDAICAVARILKENAGEGGFAFRIGGDEFGIFMYTAERVVVEKAVIDLFGEYNRQAVETDYLKNSSLSIGIALAPEDGQTCEALYAAADKALYCAKRNGKNGYCFYSVDFTDTADNRAEVVNIRQLRKLIEDTKEIREKKGVYKVNYREFQRIYNFISRCVERTHQRAKLAMVSLNCKDEDIHQIEEEMSIVEKAVVNSLRRNDVGTRYSLTQFLLVLIDVDTENLENVVETRIRDNYTRISGRDGNELLFEIMDIREE